MPTEAPKVEQRPSKESSARAPESSGPAFGAALPMVFGAEVPLTAGGIDYLQRTSGNASVVDLLDRHGELPPFDLPFGADWDRPVTGPLDRPKSLRLAAAAAAGLGPGVDGSAHGAVNGAAPGSDAAPVQRHPAGAAPSFDAGAAEAAVNNSGTPAPAAPAAGRGSGRRPARIPNRAMDVATAETALNAAYGTVHTMTRPPIVLASKRVILRAYDTYCIDNSVDFTRPDGTTRPWRRGDADPAIEGFALPDGSKIYVQRDTVLPTATAHEILHTNTAADFRAAVGEAINEGTTEHLALKAVAAAGLPTVGSSGATAYGGQVSAVRQLITVVGEGTLVGAYFGGAATLVAAYEALMPTTFAALKGTGSLDTAHMAALLVPRTPAQKVTLVSGRLSASTTAADIAAIRAICNSDAADLGAITSGVAATLQAAVLAKVAAQTTESLQLARDLAGLPIASLAALRTSLGPNISGLITGKLFGALGATEIADVTALAELPFADPAGTATAVSIVVGIKLVTGGSNATLTTLANLPFANRADLQAAYSPVVVTRANALLDGWVTDADLDQIEALYNLPITDRSAFAATIRPRATSLVSWDQRMRLRLMLAP